MTIKSRNIFLLILLVTSLCCLQMQRFFFIIYTKARLFHRTLFLTRKYHSFSSGDTVSAPLFFHFSYFLYMFPSGFIIYMSNLKKHSRRKSFSLHCFSVDVSPNLPGFIFPCSTCGTRFLHFLFSPAGSFFSAVRLLHLLFYSMLFSAVLSSASTLNAIFSFCLSFPS